MYVYVYRQRVREQLIGESSGAHCTEQERQEGMANPTGVAASLSYGSFLPSLHQHQKQRFSVSGPPSIPLSFSQVCICACSCTPTCGCGL